MALVGTSIVGFAKHMVPLYSKGSLTNNTNKDRNSLRTDCVGWEINLILRQNAEERWSNLKQNKQMLKRQ